MFQETLRIDTVGSFYRLVIQAKVPQRNKFGVAILDVISDNNAVGC